MPAHHSVDSSTLGMMPRDSIWSSSSWTLSRRGSCTCQGPYREWGTASGLKWVSVLTQIPESLEYWGELFHDVCFGFQSWSGWGGKSISVVWTWMANPRAVMAGRPRSFVLRPSTTKTHCSASFPLGKSFSQNCPRMFRAAAGANRELSLELTVVASVDSSTIAQKWQYSFYSSIKLGSCFLLIQLDGGEPCRSLFASDCVQKGCIKYVLTADFWHSFSETLGTVMSLCSFHSCGFWSARTCMVLVQLLSLLRLPVKTEIFKAGCLFCWSLIFFCCLPTASFCRIRVSSASSCSCCERAVSRIPTTSRSQFLSAL